MLLIVLLDKIWVQEKESFNGHDTGERKLLFIYLRKASFNRNARGHCTLFSIYG